MYPIAELDHWTGLLDSPISNAVSLHIGVESSQSDILGGLGDLILESSMVDMGI